ncbi:MAG: hypothetical protein JWN99_1221 [Ilumatobacteraceae bacterium]|nr:hypothetical protein [Ilumatobacteraceae bacterium]
MLTVHDLESIRRSAAMAPLSRDEMARLIDTTVQLVRERAQIADVLGRLPVSFGDVREAVNELQRIVGT